MKFTRYALAGLLVASAGCGNKKSSDNSKETPPAKTDTAELVKQPVAPSIDASTEPTIPEGQWFRATLDFGDLGEMPFFLLLPEGQSGTAYIKNNTEMAKATFAWTDDQITMKFDWAYISTLQARRGEDGTLTGDWTRDTPLWGEVIREFHASPIETPDPLTRFAGKPTDLSVAGVWKFQFETHGEGVGVFTQEGDVVSGFVRPGSLGDMRFLTGNVHDGQLRLSTFNGNSANLVLAQGNPKKLKGMISMQNVWNEPFTATKAADDWMPENKVKVTSKNSEITLPELTAYKGEPAVIILFATWCPSCNDATPFMVSLEKEFRDKGVKFHSIAFDLTEDPEAITKEIAHFKEKYSIPWTVTSHATTIEKWADDMPPELEGWNGLPVTLFIDREGKVQKVFGGWFGPAAPEASADIKEKFRTWTDEIAQKAS